MSKLSNAVKHVKLGAGYLKAGNSVFANTLRKWLNTGSYLTYKDLYDRPDYYLRRVSEHFGVTYNSSIIRKYDFVAQDAKQLKDPNSIKQSFLGSPIKGKKIAPKVSYVQDEDRIKRYVEPYYTLAFDHPDHGEIVSRKLKYYFTCEEIQTAIDTDLISGVSGFSVSSAGEIKSPCFGPYMLQSNRTGVNSNLIYVKENSDKDFISGSIEGYDGDLNLHSHYNLTFHKTGAYKTNIDFNVIDIDNNFDSVYGEFDYQDYDIEAGYYKLSESQKTYRYVNSGILAGNSGYNVGVEEVELPGIIRNHKDHRVYGVTTDLQLLFSEDVDPADTEKHIFITGVKPVSQAILISNTKINPYRAFRMDLVADGDSGPNGYTEENFWYLNAPTGYVGHRYFHYSGIKITNCSKIEGFRIPPQSFFQAEDDLSRIECTNNPNLKEIMGLNLAFKTCDYIDFSNCALETCNDLHRFHDDAFYQNNPNHNSSYPNNVFRTIPDHLREPQYNGGEIDDVYYQQVQPIEDRSPFASFLLKHLNVEGNNLNQTGCYYMIRSCMIGLQPNGYLNISNQVSRLGAEDASFEGLRSDQYKVADPSAEIIDINNHCISGIDALREYGWTIIHDGNFNRL